MSPEWEISSTLALAQLQASLARADAGSSNSRILLYTTERPASPEVGHSDVPQAEIVLEKPCGSITAGTLSLRPSNFAGAIVTRTGIPRWAEWIAGDGALLSRCNVTDTNHGGGICVAGGKTPEGETSPMLYVGGLVVMTHVALN